MLRDVPLWAWVGALFIVVLCVVSDLASGTTGTAPNPAPGSLDCHVVVDGQTLIVRTEAGWGLR